MRIRLTACVALAVAAAGLGAEPSFKSCTPALSWASFHGLEAHLVAASLKQRPEAAAEGAFEFRSALLFSPNHSDWRSGLEHLLQDYVNHRYFDFFGIPREEYRRLARRYFVCPSMRLQPLLSKPVGATCELPSPDGTPGPSLKASVMEAFSPDRTAVFVLSCLVPSEHVEAFRARGGPPRPLRIAVHLRLHAESLQTLLGVTLHQFHLDMEPVVYSKDAVARAVLPVDMCETEAPRRRVLTACTQTLDGHARIARAQPGFFQRWLEHHRRLGVEHFFVYDVDGSFEAEAEPLVRAGVVSYHGRWSERLGTAFGYMARNQRTPLCTEFYAYTHCLLSNHLVSDWVVLLHAPDEYLTLPAARPGAQGGLAEVLRMLDGVRGGVAEAMIHHQPVAGGRACADEGGSLAPCGGSHPGRVDVQRGSPLLNPELCVAGAAHHCFARRVGAPQGSPPLGGSAGLSLRPRGAPPQGLQEVLVAPKLVRARLRAPMVEGHYYAMPEHYYAMPHLAPSVVRVEHHVELLVPEEDEGRCARMMGRPCNVTSSTAWGR